MNDHVVAVHRAMRLHQQGRVREALELYERILGQSPQHAQALHHSGVILQQSGELDAARQRIEQSLRAQPAAPEAWCNLALVYQALSRHDAAIAALQEALRLDDRQAPIWSNLASCQLDSGLLDQAEISSRRAIALDATHVPGWFNLALSLQALGRLPEALESVVRAAALAPGNSGTAGLKSQIEEALGQLDAARATLDDALLRDPGAAPLHFQRASVEERLGNPIAAAQACVRVLELAPQHGPALSQLVFLRKRMADWHDLDSLQARFRDGVVAGQPYLTPFSLLSDPSTRAMQRGCSERWSALFVPATPSPAHRGLSTGRLRIGYLSADFHEHATAVLTAGLFKRHDRQRFEVRGYSTGPDDNSALRARIQSGFDRFVDARGWSSDRLANQIRDDRIDILVDLKGHTDGAPTGVLGRRPAPIQVSYLGYPGTMGAGFIDYLIGDEVVTPLAHAADYSEALVLLPHSYQINDRLRDVAEPPSRRELGLPDIGVVFCCFNSGYKFNPAVFDAWSRILRATPGSVLWLLARGDHDPLVGNLRREAASRDIDPSRLVFARFRPSAQYLALYRHADLFLDTWPYNAHTTASDALWAGCPVLTWTGETFAGRVATSLLAAIGLPELAVPDVERYVARAIEIASDAPARARYRSHLDGAGRASPLFDTAATTLALEQAYLAMAEQFRNRSKASLRIA